MVVRLATSVMVLALAASHLAGARSSGTGSPSTLIRPWLTSTLLQAGRDVISRTVSLPPGAPVSIEATIGEIQITGWDRPATAVDIRAGSAADLARMDVAIEERSPGLRIRAVQPDGGMDRSLRSSIRVNAPASTVFESVRVLAGKIVLANLRGAVTADLRRGPIEASSLAGSIRLETGVGDVRVDKAELTSGGLIRLRAFNGNVTLQLASTPPDARILALTFNGRISSDIPLTMKDKFGPRFGETTLGRGEPPISIDVVTGDIAIRVGKR